MARQDVPIVISRGDGSITVHGTAAQQRVFAAFVKMIDPGAKSEGQRNRLPERTAPSRKQSSRSYNQDPAIAAVQADAAERVRDVRTQYVAALEAANSTLAKRTDLETYVKALAASNASQVERADLQKYVKALAASNALQVERADLQTYVKALAASNEALLKKQLTLHGQAANMLQNADNLRARLLDGAYESKRDFEAKIVELQNLAQRKEVEAKAVFEKATSAKGEFAALLERLRDLEAKAAEMTRKAEALKRHIQELSGSRDE